MTSFVQNSFLGGEAAKWIQGRFDTRDYRTFMNVCVNGIPVEQGAWTRRPGTAHLGTTRRGLQGRVYPFQVKAALPVTIEFTDLHMRFWNGTQLLMTDDGQIVTNISTANPAVVTTQTAHGWSNNNEVQFILTNNVFPLLQNRQFLIQVLSSTTFALYDDLSDAPIDGSTLGWAVGGKPVTVTRVLDVGTLYQVNGGTFGTWQNIRIVQTETTGVLLNGYPPCQVTYTPSNPYPTLAWSQIQFLDGPYLDVVNNATLTPNATSGTITFTLNNIAYVNNGVGFVAADVGRAIRVFSEPPPWPGSGTGLAGDIVKFGGGYWIQQVSATTTPPGSVGTFASPTQTSTPTPGEIYIAMGALAVPTVQQAATPSSVVQWLPLTVAAAAGWRWGTIASVISASQITVSNLAAPLVYNTTINAFRLGVYGGPNGWPTCGVYHEGRLWLSGAIDNRVDASNSNDPYNFAPSAIDGTVFDSHSIAAVFNSDDVNPILWMVSDERGIVCGTQAGEWLISASTQQVAITPTNITAHRVTKNGCANIEPKRTEHTIIVVHKYMRKLLEFFSDVFSGKFTAPNLSMSWNHLTQKYVQEIAYQQQISPVIWSRMGDGSLVGMSYKRNSLTTSQGPDFSGGHRHKLGTGWKVVSVANGSNAAGTLDALTMVTYDASTNIYHVEQLTDLFEEGGIKTKAWFLDAAVRPTFWQLTTVNNVAVFQLGGLWHLNGYTATAYIGGLDCGDVQISNGLMNVPLQNDPNGLLTGQFVQNAFATGGLDMLVGMNYTSQGQTVRPMTGPETGARDGPALGKTRREHRAAALFQDADQVFWGSTFANMVKCQFKTVPDGSNPMSPFSLYSGVYTDTIGDDYSYDGMICWQVNRPFPCTVTAIGWMGTAQDR